MATRCKNEYEIKRRFKAFERLGRMNGFSAKVPPFEIFGIELDKTGAISIQDMLEALDNDK